MTELRRAFVAVVPPPAVLTAIESLVESARAPDDGLRWEPRSQWHLTLQFLGRLDELDSLTESLGESLRGVPGFDLQLGGAGAFPGPERASVVWVGVASGGAELAALAAAVNRATAPFGFTTEDRPFRPHLTVARVKPAHDVRTLIERLWTGPAGPSFTVDRAVLFDSDTRSDGAVHTERNGFALLG